MKAIQILTGCCLVLLLVGFFNVNTKAAPEDEENGSARLMKRIGIPMSVYAEGISDTGKFREEIKQFTSVISGEDSALKTMDVRRFFADTPESKKALVYSMFEKIIENQGMESLNMNDLRISALASAILSVSDAVPDAVIGGRGRYLKTLGLFGAYVIEVLDPGIGERYFEQVSESKVTQNTGTIANEIQKDTDQADTLGIFPF